MSVHGGPAEWWTQGTDAGRKHVATKGIVQNGLVLNLDAGVSDSYPGSGTTWTDLSGNANNGTLTNGPTFSSDNGGSLILDGVNDYININSITFTPYCLDFWVYNNNTINANDGAIGGPSTYQTLIAYGYPAGVNLGGWTGSATNEVLHIWSTSDGNKLTYTKTAVNSGFHNFVFNWNGAYYDIFVDGNIQSVYAGTSGHAVLQSFTSTINLGGTGTYYFNGKILNFKLYTMQLDVNKVIQNFNATRGRYGI